MVRAKFKCNVIERRDNGTVNGKAQELVTLVLNPVYHNGDPKHENTKFWNASPGGELRLNCVNAAAVAQFELGKEYYLDFTQAS